MSFLSDAALEPLIALAGDLADAAGEQTLAHFRSESLTADNKLQGLGFDPVTLADKASEAAMREILSAQRPEDGILGEEEEQIFGSSGLTWVLDPIDGTRAYISGLPVWGTLIALDDGERGRIGIIDQPYLGERFVGVVSKSPRAWTESRDGTRALKTRQGTSLRDATLFTTDPYLFDEAERSAFEEVRSEARLTRFGTDCYAYALLAMGQIDAVIETGLQAYDIASHIPLIAAAGGIVTDWEGNDCRWGGQAVAAANSDIHAELLQRLKHVAKRTK